MAEQPLGVGGLEVEGRELALGLQEDVAVCRLAVEAQLEHVVHALDVHGQALEPVGQLARDRMAVVAADLLEIGELRDLHAVAPDLPAEAPGAERRALPVVLDEAHVMGERVDADRLEALQIEVLEVVRRRLEDHLELIVVLQPVRVLAVAPVGRAARRLHVGGPPGLGAERAQRGRGMERPRPDLDVVRLQQDATLVRPEPLQDQDQILKARRCGSDHRANSTGAAGARTIASGPKAVKNRKGLLSGPPVAAAAALLRIEVGAAAGALDQLDRAGAAPLRALPALDRPGLALARQAPDQ